MSVRPERTFLVERYCSDMWPHVLGHRPFIVSGPRLNDWVVPGSLKRYGRHVLQHSVRRIIAECFPSGGIHRDHYQHRAVSETMLREGVLVALWADTQRECLPVEYRWNESIDQVARELPFNGPNDQRWVIVESVDEYLSGIPSPSMIHDYVSEDSLSLSPVRIPE